MPASRPNPVPLRVGIVGAGRTQQGLGPYLASAFEGAGAIVTAICGSRRDRAERTAASLAASLGHPVAAVDSAADLAAGVDVLVVACPEPHHLAGLDAALRHGVPCLCEKPLVGWREATAGLDRVAAFAERGQLLVENCQWPFVLPALAGFGPDWQPGARPRHLAIGLSPVGQGLGMVTDSLSHVLSVAAALAPGDDAEVSAISQDDGDPAAAANVVRFTWRAGGRDLAVALHLQRCPAPPRPAWLALDGVRVDRRIGAGYAQSFVAVDGSEVRVPDPLRLLVREFLDLLQSHDRDRTTAIARTIATRLRCYARIVRHLAGA